MHSGYDAHNHYAFIFSEFNYPKLGFSESVLLSPLFQSLKHNVGKTDKIVKFYVGKTDKKQ